MGSQPPADPVPRIGAVSYYGERSARDPAWHAQQLWEAAVREARRREQDPVVFREATARCRERQRATGLTFAQLAQRAAVEHDRASEAILRRVLTQEVRGGRVDYHSTSRRYRLNGGLDRETVAALRQL